MKDVNPELVQHFVSRSPVSPKTTRNICITLQSMWATAKAWGYVAHDVMADDPKVKYREARSPGVESLCNSYRSFCLPNLYNFRTP